MTNFQDILKRAIQIRDAVSEGANTASLVGGVMVDTLYNQNKLKQDIDGIIDSLKDLSKSDSSGGIDEITLANYLIRNGYAKKSDIPTSWWGQAKNENNEVGGSLHNVLSLLFSDSEIEITGVANANTPTSSNEKIVTPSYAASQFLSKLSDDVASGAITFEKMQKFLSGFVSAGRAILQKGFAIDENGYGFDENGNIIADSLKSKGFDKVLNEGFGMEMESARTSHLYLSNLTIWGKMIVNILEIMKTKYAGGNIYMSAAGGTIVKVVPVAMWDDDESEWVENAIEEAIQGWKCYILADDGDNAVGNPWQEGDQVRCQSMGNLLGTRYSKATNKSYWRTIPEHGVSSFNEYIYNDYGTPAYNGKMFYWIVLGKHSKDFDGYTEENAPTGTTDIPEAGDSIVLDGSRKDTSRQGVLQLSSYGSGAPSIVGLRGVSDYSHENCAIFELSHDYVRILAERFKLIAKGNKVVEITNFRGEWLPDEKYYKNDQVSHNNAIWTCIKDADCQKEPTDGSTYWRKEVYGQKGEDGSSFKVLGTAVKHFTNADDIDGELLTNKEYLFDDTSGLPDGVASPCIATYMKVEAGHMWVICKSNEGDSYMIGDDLWTNSGTAWLNIGNVKGVSISSTSVTYGVSASGTQQPSSWSSVIPPTTDEYPYLWTRTVVNYTDGKSTTSFSVSHNGKDGEKGETGDKGADAITIQLVGAPLIFDAGSDGIVPKGVTNYARLYVTVGEKDVSEYVGQPFRVSSEGMNVFEGGYTIDRREYNGKMAWYLGIKSDAISKVYLSDNKTEVSATSGYITFSFVYGANQYVGQLPFQVNVAMYTGELTLTNKQFEAKMHELSTNYDNLPLKTKAALTDYTTSINESARKISLEASKKAVDDNNAVIKKAGLEVKADGITLYGDKITITNDDGKTTTALFTGGKINASLIDVKHLWAISEDGTSKVGYFGNDTDSACIIDNNTTAPLFVGGSTALMSNFYVTSNGKMVAKDAEISGTLKGVSGTFNELTDGTGKLSIGFQDNGFFITGFTRFYNNVAIDGMLISQGQGANFLAYGVWARGTFGSNARLTLMCIDNHRYYYEKNNTKRVQGSTLVPSDGAIDGHYPYLVSMRPVTSHLGMDDGEEDCEYYGASFDLVIIRTTSKSGYYKFTNCGYGKVFHVINGYDKQSVWIAYQGGWFELYGGMGITMAYLDSSMYTPTSKKAGAGFFILGTYDNSWV